MFTSITTSARSLSMLRSSSPTRRTFSGVSRTVIELVALLAVMTGWRPACGRDRGRDQLACVVRVDVVEVEGAKHQLLVLRALDLLGDEDGAGGELLEEEPLGDEDVVERLRGRDLLEVYVERALREVAVEDDVE